MTSRGVGVAGSCRTTDKIRSSAHYRVTRLHELETKGEQDYPEHGD
jgi:hypothetical protein